MHHFAVAIVGAGPSGFYVAELLAESGLPVEIDIFERLPAPFGLVRYGVAPDHPKLKTAAAVFDRIARRTNVRLFGNVEIGTDVPLERLAECYHAVILAHGASLPSKLGIPGEDIAGSHTATEFVAWYNSHPDFASRSFDLSGDSVAIIGNGNVALDLARILAKPVDMLRNTDISSRALETLERSRIRTIHVIGRRGPGQVKFTNQELREIGQIPGVAAQVPPEYLALNSATEVELADRKNFLTKKNVEILQSFSSQADTASARRVVFHFNLSPTAILGGDRVSGLRLLRTVLQGEPFRQKAIETDDFTTLECQLVFSSIGYRGEPIGALPFDAATGTYRHLHGSLLSVTGIFATGWIKRGPTGIIGSNKPCAAETAKGVCAYLAKISPPAAKPGFESLRPQLTKPVVTYDRWLELDRMELDDGARRGKVREKLVDFPESLVER